MLASARLPVTGGRLNRRPAGHWDHLAALLVVVAFLLAGWKVWSDPPAAAFAVVQQVAATPGTPPTAASTLGASAAPKQQPSSAVGDKFQFDAQFVSAAPGQAVHAASIVELRNRDLRAVWFSGSREGAGDVTIQTAVLDHTSQRWLPESTLFDRQKIERGLWRYVKKLGNPVIARAPDGALWLWLVNVSIGGWAGSAISWSRSVDEGVSWSAPRRLVTSPFLNISTLVKGGPVAFADGGIGLPVYHEFMTKYSEILQLNPQGQVVDKIRIPGSQTSLQPVLLVSGPGQAEAYMRAGQGGKLMVAATDDAGKTWSNSQATSWPNPDSAVAAVMTRSGSPWLALNPGAVGRETLALLQGRKHSEVSKDSKGGTFDAASVLPVEGSAGQPSGLSIVDYQRLLGAELKAGGASDAETAAYIAGAARQLCGSQRCAQEFSYPYLLQTSDGYMHLVYTWHRTRIKHVRFDPLQPALQPVPQPALATGAAPLLAPRAYVSPVH